MFDLCRQESRHFSRQAHGSRAALVRDARELGFQVWRRFTAMWSVWIRAVHTPPARRYCFSYTAMLFTCCPLPLTPVVVTVLVFPSLDTTDI